ncbi:MAG: hypothetical protein IT438_05045 [Phycisphaerales bacterium]|nr:hypothetical protein [Phycisphaerales bacterium]
MAKTKITFDEEAAKMAVGMTVRLLLEQLRWFRQYRKADCVEVGVSIRTDDPSGLVQVKKLYCCTCKDGVPCSECYIGGKKIGKLVEKNLVALKLPFPIVAKAAKGKKGGKRKSRPSR